MQPPDPFEVVAATCHPATRRVELDDRAVLRTPDRPGDPRGNAVHLTGPPPDAPTLAAAATDASTRFPGRAVELRLLARRTGPAGAVRDGRALDVLVLDDAARAAGAWPRRTDVTVAPPGDDRAWHGVVVLRRHAAADDEIEAAARARGGRDELLRWWVDGRRRLVSEGRARVLVATRFGTPVGAGVLAWAPGVDVGADAAGLAVVTDVVVHPAHRLLGIATTLVAELVARHVADFPRARVSTVAPAAVTGRLAAHGWRVHERLVELRVDDALPGGALPAQR